MKSVQIRSFFWSVFSIFGQEKPPYWDTFHAVTITIFTVQVTVWSKIVKFGDLQVDPNQNLLFKVNNGNIRTRPEICSKLTIKTSERRLWYFAEVSLLCTNEYYLTPFTPQISACTTLSILNTLFCFFG